MLLRSLCQLKYRDLVSFKFPSSIFPKTTQRLFFNDSFCRHHQPTSKATGSLLPLLPAQPFTSRTLSQHGKGEQEINPALETDPENSAAFHAESNITKSTESTSGNFCFSASASPETKEEILSSFSLYLEFLTPDEELQLLKEADRHLLRLRYLYSHWDDAIEGYRETEVSRWSAGSAAVLARLRTRAFGGEENVLVHTHVLDLAPRGFIKPHVDSVRFCGSTIAGMSLGSEAVMRLVREGRPDHSVDILLPRRSLYVMRDASRYLYTHEVLQDAQFGRRPVVKHRRVSVICRNHPPVQGDQTT